MSPTQGPRPASSTKAGVEWAVDRDQLHRLAEEARSGLTFLSQIDVEPAASSSARVAVSNELFFSLSLLVDSFRGGRDLPVTPSASYLVIAHNMAEGVAALGPALAEIDTPVSPQLARSLAATENAWRRLEMEFGLLSSREVSELMGSRSPNRSYASEQRSRGKLIAVKRPGGLRYPGYQFDRSEHAIRPVMAELIRIAADAGRSEASLALWMTTPTGYLDGDRPVDQLSDPDKVVEAAQQSFNVEW